MPDDSSRSCPSCGAHVPDDRDRCDLCGTPLPEPSPQEEPPPSDAEAAGADSSGVDAAHADSPAGEASEALSSSSEDAEEDATDRQPDTEPDASAPVYCNDCGWKNPSGARFCSQCGTPLQDLSAADAEAPRPGAPKGTRPVAANLPSAPDATEADRVPPSTEDETDAVQQELGQQLTLTVGVAVLVVVGLFFVTFWSQRQEWGGDAPAPSPQTPTQSGARSPGGSGGVQAAPLSAQGGTFQDLSALAEQTATPLPNGLAQRVDSVRTAMDAASGSEKQRLRQELANLYVGGGQAGKAALQQLEIARSTDDTEAWRRAADRLYAWMQSLQQQGQRQQAVPIAEEAADAYAVVAERDASDLMAQTRMGEAFLLTNNPMRGIQTINDVLASDSTFVPARFQKGLALLQISRFEQAIAEFERVKTFAGEGAPYYQQADRAIEIIRERTTTTQGSAQEGS